MLLLRRCQMALTGNAAVGRRCMCVNANIRRVALPSMQVPEVERPPVPKLAICIMIAGTRGDVQPFIALGLKLKVRRMRCLVHGSMSRIVDATLFILRSGSKSKLSPRHALQQHGRPMFSSTVLLTLLEENVLCRSTGTGCGWRRTRSTGSSSPTSASSSSHSAAIRRWVSGKADVLRQHQRMFNEVHGAGSMTSHMPMV